jgi:hypothetical protein
MPSLRASASTALGRTEKCCQTPVGKSQIDHLDALVLDCLKERLWTFDNFSGDAAIPID